MNILYINKYTGNYAHTSPAEFHEIVLLVQLEHLLRPHLQGLRWLPGREASFGIHIPPCDKRTCEDGTSCVTTCY